MEKEGVGVGEGENKKEKTISGGWRSKRKRATVY